MGHLWYLATTTVGRVKVHVPNSNKTNAGSSILKTLSTVNTCAIEETTHLVLMTTSMYIVLASIHVTSRPPRGIFVDYTSRVMMQSTGFVFC